MAPSTLSQRYLLLYNTLSFGLWLTILLTLLGKLPTHGLSEIYTAVGALTRNVQSLAVLEILHSILHVVRAPLATTAIQVASRILLVHGIVAPFPHTAGEGNPWYASMVFAWSVTEVVRYGFFANGLLAWDAKGESVLGRGLLLARYNTFFVLYPLGIASEVATIWRAMGEMMGLANGELGLSGNGVYGLAWWACAGVLAVYVPGSWVMYTHMMKQRRKVLGGGKPREDGRAVKKRA